MLYLLDTTTSSSTRSVITAASNPLTPNITPAGVTIDLLGCGASCPPISYGGKMTGLNDPNGHMNGALTRVIASNGLSGMSTYIMSLDGMSAYRTDRTLSMSNISATYSNFCTLKLFDDLNPIPTNSTVDKEIYDFKHTLYTNPEAYAILIIKTGITYHIYGYNDYGVWTVTPVVSGELIHELSKTKRTRNIKVITTYAFITIRRTLPSGMGLCGGGTASSKIPQINNSIPPVDISDASIWFDAASEKIKSSW